MFFLELVVVDVGVFDVVVDVLLWFVLWWDVDCG